MTLDELKAQAAAVLAIQPASGYTHETFTTNSGGGIKNPLGIPEVHRGSQYKYGTVRNGNAYAGSLTVECRDTGTADADGRTIYETPAGVVFVYVYRRGSAEHFDSGRLAAPNVGPGEGTPTCG